MGNSTEVRSLLCHGCLSKEKLYNIHRSKLAELYKNIIDSQVSVTEELPHLCNICCCLLFKYSAFRERCQRARTVLRKSTNCELLKISSLLPYVKTDIQTICYPETEVINKVTVHNNELEMQNIIENDIINEIKLENDFEDTYNQIHTEELFLMNVNGRDPVDLQGIVEKREHIEEDLVENVILGDELDNIVKKRLRNGINVQKTVMKQNSINEHLNQTDKLEERVNKRQKKNVDDTLHKEELILLGINDIDLQKTEKEQINLKENLNECDKFKKKDGITPKEKGTKETKDVETLNFKQKGKYFETTDNIANFEKLYDVNVIVLSKEEQMKDILSRMNGFDYPFKCNDCYKGFMDEDILEKHRKALHDISRGDAVCEICRVRYKDNRNLNRHLRRHRLKFACRQCSNVTRNTGMAIEHYKMHYGNQYKCEHCGQEYERSTTYLTHMRVKHPSELIWCCICGDSSISEFGLNAHKHLAHKELKFPDDCKCVKCDAGFTNADALRRHATMSCDKSDVKSCDKLSSCIHCGEGFPARLLLKDHLLKVHRNSGGKTLYPCAKCDKVFTKYNLYSAHYRRIHNNKDKVKLKCYICEVCGKSLPNTSELRCHQRIHTGDKPFHCTECPKTFIKRAVMMSHMRVHSNERPFACKHCPKTFKGPAALRGHQYVHSGVKPPIQRRKRSHLIEK